MRILSRRLKQGQARPKTRLYPSELGRRRGLGALRRFLLACRRSSLGGLDRLRRRLTLLGRLNPELLGEPLDPALGVDELLSTSEERMAGGADFQVQLRLGRAGFERVSTRAASLDLLILRVDTFLHGHSLSQNGKL